MSETDPKNLDTEYHQANTTVCGEFEDYYDIRGMGTSGKDKALI